MLKIVTIPNPVLTQPTKKVEQFDVTLQKLVKDMDQTLRAQINPQGVGLAAPQVGVNLSVFISKPTPNAKTEVFVNPSILKLIHPQGVKKNSAHPKGVLKTKRKTKLEGCLSIPKIWGSVKRAEKVLLEFQDQTGKVHKKWFSGFRTIIIQHEVDHLAGVLFTQRALEQKTTLFEEKEGKLNKLKYQ